MSGKTPVFLQIVLTNIYRRYNDSNLVKTQQIQSAANSLLAKRGSLKQHPMIRYNQ